MTLLWAAATASLVAALLAWRNTRTTARRLEQLSQMHWELKYQQGELRHQVQRLTAGGNDQDGAGGAAEASRHDGFVPLSSLKR